MLTRFSPKIINLALIIFFIVPIFAIAQTANDPLNNELYWLSEIKVFDAWDYTTGSKNIVVAVIDTGIDIDHPDIYENIWLNKDEIVGDGIDNDNNGYIDDINGWDFIRNESDPNPKFDAGHSELGIEHGTLVAGIIGARGNNAYGVSGLNWQVSLMSLVALDGYGNGNMSDVVEAIDYATANGADIINMSLVGSASDNKLSMAVARAYQAGVIVVAAAGNESVGDTGQDNSVNLLTDPRYPVCIDGTMGDNYILGVGSIDITDKKSLFSNYGTQCLDINAPGEYFYGLNIYQPIFSDYRNKFTGYWSGTSLATPLVSGAAALIKAYRPQLSNREVYNLILDNADNIDSVNASYKGKMGKGKLNLAGIFNQAKNIVSIQSGVIVVSPGGFAPYVFVYSSSGATMSQFLAFDKEYFGGVNLARVAENSVDNIITAQSDGGEGYIRIFTSDGTRLGEWQPTGFAMGSGLKVANLKNRVLVWSEDSNNKLVQLYTMNGELLNQFTASGPIYDIVGADVDNDNVHEINILSTGKVLVYNQLGNINAEILLGGTAGSLAIGNNQIVTGAHVGQEPRINVYSLSGVKQRTWLAYNINFKGGMDIAMSNDAIIVGPGKSGGPHLRSFDFFGNLQFEFFTLDQKNSDGINVGYINL